MLKKEKKNILIAASVLIAGSWVWSKFSNDTNSFKDTVQLLPVVIPLIGAFTSSKKNVSTGNKNNNINLSFENGIYGGLIGGLIAAIVVAIAFHLKTNSLISQFMATGQCPDALKNLNVLLVSLKIIPFGAVIGLLVGGFVIGGMKLFSNLFIINRYLKELSGGIVGGAIAGLLSGILGAWLFMNVPTPYMGATLIMSMVVIGCFSIVMGTLIYTYDGKIKYILRAACIVLVLNFIFLMLVSLLFEYIPFLKNLEQGLNSGKAGSIDYYKGGALTGGIIGIASSFVISLSVFSFDYWKYAESKNENKNNKSNTVTKRRKSKLASE